MGFINNKTTKASLLLALLISQNSLSAKPYTPKSDSEVIAKVKNSQRDRKLKDLYIALQKQNNNIDLAYLVADGYIRLGMDRSDPRYYSYAESALKPWWEDKDPPSSVLLARANIKQYRHQFDAALKDLDTLLARAKNAQALFMRVNILGLQGRFEEARYDCQRLEGLVNYLTQMTCINSIDSMTGKAPEAYTNIKDAFFKLGKNIDQSIGTLIVLADIATRLKKFEEAEKYYKQALKANEEYNYLYAAYSDTLLDQGKAKAVIDLLKDRHQDNDNLLLRYVLAKQELKSPDLAEYITMLKKNFALSRKLNDVHQREEAIFALKLEGNIEKALSLAKKNWSIQKEALDLRVLLETAIAANDQNLIQETINYIDKSKIQDWKLDQLREGVNSDEK